jgi:hypothetical protein
MKGLVTLACKAVVYCSFGFFLIVYLLSKLVVDLVLFVIQVLPLVICAFVCGVGLSLSFRDKRRVVAIINCMPSAKVLRSDCRTLERRHMANRKDADFRALERRRIDNRKGPFAINIREAKAECFIGMDSSEIRAALNAAPFDQGDHDFGRAQFIWKWEGDRVECWFQSGICYSCEFYTRGRDGVCNVWSSAQR